MTGRTRPGDRGPARSGPVRSGPSRALRYGAGASALVLLVCVLIASLSAWTLRTVGAQVGAATARTLGEVTFAEGRTVQVHWTSPAGPRTDTLDLAIPAPPVGTRTEIAYDPRDTSTVLMPGSDELAALDRARSGVVFSALVAVLVLATGGWQVHTRYRLRAREAVLLPVRRVRVQAGLLTRSFLELEPAQSSAQRWVPVHFDPVLATLPAPAVVRLHGDPRHDRLVAAEVDGTWLYPSGPVHTREPRGRRTDSPARPDLADVHDQARFGWRRQLRSDAVLLTPAPLVGLFWAYLDGGGAPTWAGATALTAALALWWAALRGSDPS